MPSVFKFRTPSKDELRFAHQDLRDKVVYRGTTGFVTKFFDAKPWSAAVQRVLQSEETAAYIKSADRLEALQKWSDNCQSQLMHEGGLSFSALEPGATGSAKTCICIWKKSKRRTRDDTVVFGEYHYADREIFADGSRDLLCFFRRAQQLFAWQPTRRFLHAFLVQGFALELWNFDRAGAYSSEKLDLTENPQILLKILTSYIMMSSEDLGFSGFLKHTDDEAATYITLNQGNRLYLQPKALASPDYIVGPGTSCYGAAESISAKESVAVKFSWRKSSRHLELDVLKQLSGRHVQGLIQLYDGQDLDSIERIRNKLQFAESIPNLVMSCLATTPLGHPLYQFHTIPQLLIILGDIVVALRSLYVGENILHRDIAIKNIVWTMMHGSEQSVKGILIDLDATLNLDEVNKVDKFTGSDGFVAIGVLLGQKHTYRHDLESLFYVFLWLAIGNQREYAHPSIILLGLPETSRLRQWCSTDHRTIADAKAADMTIEGFQEVLNEFSDDFVHLRGLAVHLRDLLFPIHDGTVFTGTDMDKAAAEILYKEMSSAFRLGAAEGLESAPDKPSDTKMRRTSQ